MKGALFRCAYLAEGTFAPFENDEGALKDVASAVFERGHIRLGVIVSVLRCRIWFPLHSTGSAAAHTLVRT